jgi:hypothetical protein
MTCDTGGTPWIYRPSGISVGGLLNSVDRVYDRIRLGTYGTSIFIRLSRLSIPGFQTDG